MAAGEGVLSVTLVGRACDCGGVVGQEVESAAARDVSEEDCRGLAGPAGHFGHTSPVGAHAG